jgi:hypothetical protein
LASSSDLESTVSTRAGGDPKARRTVLCSDTPSFVLYRLAVRFLAWIGHGLKRRQIEIPDVLESPQWDIQARFDPPEEAAGQAA